MNGAPPQKLYSHPYILFSTQGNLVNVTLFGKGVFADVIKGLQMRPPWTTQVGPTSNDNILIRDRKEQMNTEEEKAMWRQRQRLELWRNMPRNARSQQILEEARIDSPLEASKGAQSCQQLDFRFLTSKLWENKVMLSEATKFVVICYNSPKKLIDRCQHRNDTAVRIISQEA